MNMVKLYGALELLRYVELNLSNLEKYPTNYVYRHDARRVLDDAIKMVEQAISEVKDVGSTQSVDKP